MFLHGTNYGEFGFLIKPEVPEERQFIISKIQSQANVIDAIQLQNNDFALATQKGLVLITYDF